MKLYGLAEFAEALGWDRRKLSTYRTRGAIPEPYQTLASGPVWTEEQVQGYKQHRNIEDLQRALDTMQHDRARSIGRLYAVIERVLEKDQSLNPQAIQLASIEPGRVKRMLVAATAATERIERGAWYRDRIGERLQAIDRWPDTLTNEQQATWFLGYYAGRRDLQKEIGKG